MSEPFCYMPWHSIYIEANGIVRNCCVSLDSIADVNDIKTGLSTLNIPIKQAMLDRTNIKNCSHCFNKPGHTLANYFDELMERWDSKTGNYQDLELFNLLYLDVRWRNTCTSACVYCSPTFSSAWAKEIEQHLPMQRDQLTNLQKWIEPELKNLKRVYLAGGEPLIVKDNEWLLEKLLVENPDCELLINTNVQNLDTRVFELIQKFNNKNVQWVISGENTGDKYEYVRYGSNWEIFKNNLLKLKEIYGREAFVFNLLYHILNTSDIFDYIDFILKNGFMYHQISITYVHHTDLDPRNLTSQHIESIINDIDSYTELHTELKKVFSGVKEMLEIKMHQTPDIKNSIAFLETLDNRRNLNSKVLWPELYGRTN